MRYVVVIPLGNLKTFLDDSGDKGVKLCYRKDDACKFSSREAANAAIAFIGSPEIARVEEF